MAISIIEDTKKTIKIIERSFFVILLVPLFDHKLSFQRWVSGLRPFSPVFSTIIPSLVVSGSWSSSSPVSSVPVSAIISSISTFVESSEIVIAALGSLAFLVFRVFHVHFCEQFSLEALWEWLYVHVVAVTASLTTAIDVLFAFCIHEISDGWKYGVNFFASKESAIDIFLSNFCVVFVWIFDINVSDQMITEIIDNNHILNFSELTHFFKDILIEFFEPWIGEENTFRVPFQRLPVWRGYRKWGRFRWRCYHTYVRAIQFSWWGVCYGFFHNCHRIDRLRFCRRKDSWLCPFTCRRLLITFRPLRVVYKNYNRQIHIFTWIISWVFLMKNIGKVKVYVWNW